MRLIPVAERASWFDLGSCKTSPKAVIAIGPLIPLFLIAPVMDCATLKTLAPAGKLHFWKSHQTETFTDRDSSSC